MHIRRPLATDLSDMSHVASNAMFDDELTAFIAPYRHQHPECMRLGFLRRTKGRFYRGNYLLVAVSDRNDPWWDGTERVVGYLSATSTEDDQRKRRSWRDDLELALLGIEAKFVEYTYSDRSVSPRNMSAYLSSGVDMNDADDPLAQIKEHWHVDFLAVEPACQRHGVGRALIRSVQSVAEKDGLPIVLVASVAGRPMYTKCGFVDVGAVDLGVGLVGQGMAWYPEDAQVSKATAGLE